MPHIILFYKYAPLSSDPAVMKIYQNAMYDLCETLHLTGRVLVGMSDNAEGINGTLAGDNKNDVLAYTYAMLGHDWCSNNNTDTEIFSPESDNSQKSVYERLSENIGVTQKFFMKLLVSNLYVWKLLQTSNGAV